MIFRKTIKRSVTDSLAEKIVCSRCGAALELIERTFGGDGRWQGAFLTGTLYPGLAERRGGMSSDAPKVEIAWEFCAGCLTELREWVGNDGDPSRGMKIPEHPARLLEDVPLRSGKTIPAGAVGNVEREVMGAEVVAFEWLDEGTVVAVPASIVERFDREELAPTRRLGD